ncbi:hypothetical protein GCM10029992_04190 [Glycomyces albus]
MPAKGTREAEMAKLLENTYRHVNIALVNEMAVFCRELGVDLWDAIGLAKTKPFGYQAFYPGPGVGGHCIPIDPNYLSYKVRTLGYPFRFVELAQEINNRMPEYVVNRAMSRLNQNGLALSRSRVLLLGVTYKPDIADQRESPAEPVAKKLIDAGAEVAYHDPHVDSWKIAGHEVERVETLAGAKADLIVLLTNHSAYSADALPEESRSWTPEEPCEAPRASRPSDRRAVSKETETGGRRYPCRMASLTPAERLKIAVEADETRLRMYRMTLLRSRPDMGDSELRGTLMNWACDEVEFPDIRRAEPGALADMSAPQVNSLERAYAHLADAFDSLEAPWALAGSLAVSARVEPRYTTHATVLLPVTDEQVAQDIIEGLTDSGYKLLTLTERASFKPLDGDADPASVGTGDFEIIRPEEGRISEVSFVDADTPDRELFVDLCFHDSKIESEVVRAADELEILPGQSMPVARIGHLIALGLLSFSDQVRRPVPAAFEAMDQINSEKVFTGIRMEADLELLRGAAGDEDLSLAKEAVGRIAERETHPGLNLRAELASFMRQ